MEVVGGVEVTRRCWSEEGLNALRPWYGGAKGEWGGGPVDVADD